MTSDDMELTKTTMNTSNYSAAASGKLDFRLTSTINLSFGGTFTMYDNNNFNYGGSMLDWKYNSHSNGYTWRLNGRFTQRFPTTNEKAFVKNVNYSIGADFTRNYAKTQDPGHQNELFKYGYVGQFETFTNRAYPENMLIFRTVSGTPWCSSPPPPSTLNPPTGRHNTTNSSPTRKGITRILMRSSAAEAS
jgi:hypothetical protein